MTDPPTSRPRSHVRLDRIDIRGLEVMATVGVLPHERSSAQPIRIDLGLHVDLHEAGLSDELETTADYGDVAMRVADLVRESKDLLLERLATRIAEEVVAVRRIEAVEVTVTKMRPPIPANLETTSVSIVRSRRELGIGAREGRQAIIALGSNLGDREAYLRRAVRALPDVVSISRVFETDPVGGPDGQGPYLNMAVMLSTTLDPYALLRTCQRIEADAMRQRVVHWGPRTLDVDILFYDDVEIDDPELIVPHPRWSERSFVLAPLADIAPERCPDEWESTVPLFGVRPVGALLLDGDE